MNEDLKDQMNELYESESFHKAFLEVCLQIRIQIQPYRASLSNPESDRVLKCPLLKFDNDEDVFQEFKLINKKISKLPSSQRQFIQRIATQAALVVLNPNQNEEKNI